jgi:hypothetical protein
MVGEESMQIQTQEDQSLARALEIFSSEAAEVAARARRALDILLEGVYHSCWPEVAWRFGRLTADRFPVRFTFMPDSPAIVYACEIAGPETAEFKRLDQALEMMVKLGVGQLAKEQVRQLHAIQAGRNLMYRPWISGQHDRQSDCYKLYVEVPQEGGPAAEHLVRKFLGREILLETRETRLRMIGCELPTGQTELYFQAEGIETWELGRLLSYAARENAKQNWSN